MGKIMPIELLSLDNGDSLRQPPGDDDHDHHDGDGDGDYDHDDRDEECYHDDPGVVVIMIMDYGGCCFLLRGVGGATPKGKRQICFPFFVCLCGGDPSLTQLCE